MVGNHQILCNENHKIVIMVGWPTLVNYVIFMISVQAYLKDAYHLSTPHIFAFTNYYHLLRRSVKLSRLCRPPIRKFSKLLN